MWLNDLLPPKAEIRPTRPTSKNNVGRPQSLMAVAPSDTSDTSDTKKEKETLFGDFPHKEKEIAQVSSEDPLSVRHCGNPLSQKGNEEKAVGRAYGEKDFPVESVGGNDEPTPAQLDHARRMLVDCPSTGGKLHCWHCSRCDDTRTCSAWRTRRHDVEFFRKSGEPYSLFLVECGAVEVVQ